MELLGSISNPEKQERLRRLSDKLDQVAASEAKPRRSGRADQRLRPGVVLNAIMFVLASAEQPMRAKEIHEAVMALLEQPVTYSSVKACLADKAQGVEAPFERTARGCYRLRKV